MNSQKILLSVLFSLILVSSLASALQLTTPATLTISGNQTVVTLTNDNNVTQNITISLSPNYITSGSSNQVSLSLAQTQVNSLAPSDTKQFNISATSFSGNFPFGTYKTTLNALGVDSLTGASVSNATTTVSYSKTFCKSGPIGGNLSLEVSISNSGKDDTTWLPLDDVTVKVTVNDESSDTVRSVITELALYDENGRNVVSNLDFVSSDAEKVSLGSISNNEKTTFEFKVPADFKTGAYELAVKAYSDKEGESRDCVDTSSDLSDNSYEPITVDSQDDKGKYIAFDNIQPNPIEATCGDSINLNFDAFNVGTDDQDRVRVNVVSKDLAVDTSQEMTSGLNSGDSSSLSFPITIPNNLQNKIYYLLLSSDYDYRNGNYRQSSNEDIKVPVTIIGCNVVPNNTNSQIAAISASLTSDAKAGSPMTVDAKITNLASTPQMLIVDATGYTSWATLDSISDRVLSLAPGESRDVTLNFNVNSDASGDKTFQVKVTSDQSVQTRDVSVSIAKSSGMFSLSSDNSLIWVIGIINLVLIILIIFVAIRIARR